MTLFEHHAVGQKQRLAPLATRMRPKSFDDFVGQAHIVGTNAGLRRSLAEGHLPSIIMWGPPGTGKTTLASLLAAETKSHFVQVSAVASGVAELRQVMAMAGDRLGMNGRRTILFVDEIHRFNKGQQDVILPYVEDGTIILIGATTENPSFEVVSPLLSRATVYNLKPLTVDEIKQIIKNAQAQGSDPIKGLGVAWWKAGFNYYTRAIKMPVLVMGFGQYLISDNPDNFVDWDCLPRSPSNFGYMFGRQAGQARETFPKIFVPGHNK